MNDIITSYKDMWIKAIDFKGRSTVSEYWWPFLINTLITLCFMYLIPVPFLTIGYHLIIFIPCLALAIRRMHDINKSGWNILWLYIPTILLLVYAGAILYYTQSPEIVDMFLNFFTAMVVGYVVFLIYSIYLLTHYTYPKKNHYGEVPHIVEKEIPDEVILEAPTGANVEGTLTFKTKAFIEKARNIKKRTEMADTKPLDHPKQDETVKETSKDNTRIAAKTEKIVLSLDETNHPKKEQKQAVKKEVIKPKQQLAETEILSTDTVPEKEEIIVMAQLKPKKPIKKPKKDITKQDEKISSAIKDNQEKTQASSLSKEPAEPKVKTLAEKRAELQQTMNLSKTALMEEIKKTEETKKTASSKSTVRRPIKRKVIQPVEVPNMNVETIRTHSLDSIAKLVEQNMTKNPDSAPVVTATMKKKPIKRKKQE